jgi:hypothetical protein
VSSFFLLLVLVLGISIISISIRYYKIMEIVVFKVDLTKR